MSAERWSTFSKLERLLRETSLNATQFVTLADLYGIKISDAKVSLALKAGGFANHKASEALRPLVLRLEDLVERAKPFRISFEAAESTKLVLDLIGFGIDVQATPIGVNGSNAANDGSQI